MDTSFTEIHYTPTTPFKEKKQLNTIARHPAMITRQFGRQLSTQIYYKATPLFVMAVYVQTAEIITNSFEYYLIDGLSCKAALTAPCVINRRGLHCSPSRKQQIQCSSLDSMLKLFDIWKNDWLDPFTFCIMLDLKKLWKCWQAAETSRRTVVSALAV